MAYDLLKGEQVPGDWSLGDGDGDWSDGWGEEQVKSLVKKLPWKTVGIVAGGLVGAWLLLPLFFSRDAKVRRPRLDDEDQLLKETRKVPYENMEDTVYGRKD